MPKAIAYYQPQVCRCGCGERFLARLSYRLRDEDGDPTFPVHKRGHHPNCRKNQTGRKPAWNAGLKKGDHPSIARMGYQPGHEPFGDWSRVNALLRDDPKVRRRWLKAKKGQVAWNKGLTKNEYPNGIASGEEHGNWLGGHGGVRDTAEFQQFRRMIMKRDNWTCRRCGDHNYKGRGSRVVLHVDHIVPLCVAPDRALDPKNARTLCFSCHVKTATYGLKVKRYIRKREARLKRLPSQ